MESPCVIMRQYWEGKNGGKESEASTFTQADLGEGPRGPPPPPAPFFLPLTLRFCFENRFIRCSLILFSERLKLPLITLHHEYAHNALLYAACPENWSFHSRGERVGDSVPSFWIFWIRPCFTLSRLHPVHYFTWQYRMDFAWVL